MAKLFSREARSRKVPDIIIAGLPIHDCAYEAVKYGKENRVPVVVDIRDYWPDNYLLLFPKRFRWIGRLIFGRDFRITKAALQNATALIAMMSHMLDWGLRTYAMRNRSSDDQVFFIGGDECSFGQAEKLLEFHSKLEVKTQGRFVVNYIGSFSYLNHPLVIVEAAKYLNSIGQKDNIVFLLAGSGDYYESCVKAAKGHDNVVFLGWVDAEEIAVLNSLSSVGVIPSFERVSFPNKAFSYLGGGLPILSSDRGDLHTLLVKYNAGFYFDIADPIELGNKVVEVSRLDQVEYSKLRANAKLLFRDQLSAEEIYRRYADHVEHIAWKYSTERKSKLVQANRVCIDSMRTSVS
jgi:glycosyltransferase involved in cell wall biosynthesis